MLSWVLGLLVVGMGLIPSSLRAQQDEPWVIYGFSATDAGDSTFVRIEIGWTEPASMGLAMFGEEVLDFESVEIAEDSSVIAFSWPERAFADCEVRRVENFHWRGVCRSSRSSGDRVLSLGGGYIPDLGQDLEPGPEDLRILDRAVAILSSEETWNRADERICTDDLSSKRFSLFCALYVASLEVSEQYLHLRPVMEAVRTVIGERASARIVAHTLRDYNNSDETSHAEMLEYLRMARSILAAGYEPDLLPDGGPGG